MLKFRNSSGDIVMEMNDKGDVIRENLPRKEEVTDGRSKETEQERNSGNKGKPED